MYSVESAARITRRISAFAVAMSVFGCAAPATASELVEVFRAPDDERIVQSFALSPTGKFLVTYAHVEGSRDRPNYIYDLSTKSKCNALNVGKLRFAISVDARVLVTCGGDKSELIVQTSMKSGNWNQVLGKIYNVGEFALSGDGMSIAYGTREAMFLQRLDSGQKVKVGDERMLYGDMCFSGDGKRLAISYNSKIEVFDAADGRVLFSDAFPHHTTGSLSVSDNGNTLVAMVGPSDGHIDTSEQELWAWDLDAKRRIDQFKVRGQGFSASPVLSPDGKRVAVTTHVKSSPIAIRTYDIGKGNLAVYELASADILKLAPNCGYVRAVFGQSNSELMFATSGAAVLLWKLEKKDRIPYQD